MTTPLQQVEVFDRANHLLNETPCQMVLAVIPTPSGQQRLALTIRTASTTLTVLLDGAEAKAWARQLTAQAASMSSTGLIAGNGTVKP